MIFQLTGKRHFAGIRSAGQGQCALMRGFLVAMPQPYTWIQLENKGENQTTVSPRSGHTATRARLLNDTHETPQKWFIGIGETGIFDFSRTVQAFEFFELVPFSLAEGPPKSAKILQTNNMKT